jgi:hypothetical protein
MIKIQERSEQKAGFEWILGDKNTLKLKRLESEEDGLQKK